MFIRLVTGLRRFCRHGTRYLSNIQGKSFLCFERLSIIVYYGAYLFVLISGALMLSSNNLVF